MAVKKSAKKPARKPKKPAASKAKGKPAPGGTFLAHWLLDASLESFAPAQDFAPGERQLEFSVRANQATLPHPGLARAELRLRAHIHVQGVAVAMAEVKYAGVVEKARMAANSAAVLAELYPFARVSLASLLQLSGHQPPLPERLEANQPTHK